MALKAGRVGVRKDQVDNNGIIVGGGGGGEPYELPIASAETLGGIKVGENLSITEGGVLSASGSTGSSLYEHRITTAASDYNSVCVIRNNSPTEINTGKLFVQELIRLNATNIKRMIQTISKRTEGNLLTIGVYARNMSGNPDNRCFWVKEDFTTTVWDVGLTSTMYDNVIEL